MRTKSYERMPGFVAAGLGEELALLDMVNGVYLGFNATAAHVWSLLDRPRTIESLRDGMMEEFDVEAERCRVELSTLLDAMQAEGLVKARDADPR
jgi:hypothetical protein